MMWLALYALVSVMVGILAFTEGSWPRGSAWRDLRDAIIIAVAWPAYFAIMGGAWVMELVRR